MHYILGRSYVTDSSCYIFNVLIRFSILLLAFWVLVNRRQEQNECQAKSAYFANQMRDTLVNYREFTAPPRFRIVCACRFCVDVFLSNVIAAGNLAQTADRKILLFFKAPDLNDWSRLPLSILIANK